MAEVKNAFIKSKMNKDLDSRLIPQGEYRDAVNIQVSKSEGDDVGALENVLGNHLIADFENNSGVTGLNCIGYFVDEFNNNIYLFFTDYTDDYDQPTPIYNPSANNFIYKYNSQSGMTKLVEGAFLNFSTNRPIIGVNILEEFLFFTDNRNQPRKININLANPSSVSNPTYYNKEENISVAKYYPYQSIEVLKETSTPGVYETTMKDVFSEFIPLNEGSLGVPTPPNKNNQYYNQDFAGDPQYLEDKFIRFSYRFKFEDGEYSLLAPFTQVCFIPKQDGYFLEGDEQQTFASTVVGFMENKVNQIDLQIPLPSNANQLQSEFHVSEIDIIYKESDGLALQVVETIPVSNLTSSSNIFEYTYNSTKPYKTLAEKEITRVYDKVPVKALGQEIISNRIVYSNFQDKHTPPAGLNYQVAANEKYPLGSSIFQGGFSTVEYPNHSLKENRNYQVGIILADKSGRQSTVILSNNTNDAGGGFGADTVYLPYRNVNDSITFDGDSLKILFDSQIQSTKNESFLTPGLYDDNVNSSDYKPLGWYSYKIVVKQLEQEYYNVYSAGAMKDIPYNYDTGNPPSVGNEVSPNTSFVTLINDNINKVPRDLTEVGPQDKSFRSSVRLFGRVNNTDNNFSNIGNEQYFPGRKSFTTNVIEDLFDLFDVLQFINSSGSTIPITSPENAYHGFYKSDSNPFIAEFITTQTTADQFGVFNEDAGGGTADFQDIENLAILETAPTVSRLDLFYETSTSGLIEDLNTAVIVDSGGAAALRDWVYTHSENDALGTSITQDFYFEDALGSQITMGISVSLSSVIDNTGTNRTSEFILITGTNPGDYKIQTAAYFYYGPNSNQQESYNFNFSVVYNGFTNTFTQTGLLSNDPPIITGVPTTQPITLNQGEFNVITGLSGFNGSADTTRNQLGLTFSITNKTGSCSGCRINNNNSVVNDDSNASGFGTFDLVLTDAGSPQVGSTSETVQVQFDKPSVDTQFNGQTYFLNDADGAAIWFTNDVVSLTENVPTYLSGSTGPPLYTYGLQAPSALNTTINDRICPIGQNLNATFHNKTTTGGLTQGTFYVLVRGINSRLNSVVGAQNNINVRWAISYRPNSSGCPASCWGDAVDIIGNSIGANKISSTFRYNTTSPTGYAEGYDATQNDSLDVNNNPYGQTGITVRNANTSSAAPEGALVYAFNIVGEYRLIIGNLQSTYGAMQTGSLLCSNVQDSDVEAEYEIGDFYYPQAAWMGDGDGVFEYRIATSSACGTSFINTSTVYYAREPFAKYLTQLYTDQNLTTPATISSTGLRYRRMETRGSSTPSNPEYTVEGAYIGYFNNGLKAPGSSPCLW
jgi:hypothetical protein